MVIRYVGEGDTIQCPEGGGCWSIFEIIFFVISMIAFCLIIMKYFALINQVNTRLIRISDISATSHAQLIRQTTTKNLGTFLYLLVKSALSHRLVEKRSFP